MPPTVILGFSDEYGSWKTTWIRRWSARDRLAQPPSVQPDLAAVDRLQPGQGPGERGLARAGLAHQAERLAPLHLQVDPVNRAQQAHLMAQPGRQRVAGAERDRHVPRGEERGVAWPAASCRGGVTAPPAAARPPPGSARRAGRRSPGRRAAPAAASRSPGSHPRRSCSVGGTGSQAAG